MADFQRRLSLIKPCDEDEFEFNCSDEELTKDGVEWEPKPEEIAELFESLDKNKVLNLEWQCPEKRPLTPDNNTDLEDKFSNERMDIYPVNTGFDFEEEASPMKMHVRPAGPDSGPRGSAKKKTTNLDDILSSMARHRKMDMMEDDEPMPLL